MSKEFKYINEFKEFLKNLERKIATKIHAHELDDLNGLHFGQNSQSRQITASASKKGDQAR
ncbi:hypothetical protein [Campylobacter sp.]|uniref:hypothetical protein n=1 Tax=Campylobacter sp. TaxID=205 RepID=UPI003F9EC2A7